MKPRFPFWSAGKGLSDFCPGAEPDPFLLVKRRKLLGFHRSMMILIRFRKVSVVHCGAFHTEFRLKPVHSENTGSNPAKRMAE